MTKMVHTPVFPKVLQIQSVPLVCKVFDDKALAAFETVKDNLKFQPGTIKFVGLIPASYLLSQSFT